ncbi:uncharacterized protein BO72DRAFT_485428 [Aspergillus fijiensis CBS 313.89]|uniref:Uncharacterized protein n=1 Tax=Aspergillus fijiensis CBS 313.89 TaxID=1448319 RepID=A0A8G1RWS8_9EURO|nr:uncharacterized protein BO72DRAFT_485428 [Aspergillus fijiensis CBS 313.89]RAK78231.1 hypothetical protein BO72DRAFT_485428 [Aspergillus fijiensis CBS 313.89]
MEGGEFLRSFKPIEYTHCISDLGIHSNAMLLTEDTPFYESDADLSSSRNIKCLEHCFKMRDAIQTCPQEFKRRMWSGAGGAEVRRQFHGGPPPSPKDLRRLHHRRIYNINNNAGRIIYTSFSSIPQSTKHEHLHPPSTAPIDIPPADQTVRVSIIDQYSSPLDNTIHELTFTLGANNPKICTAHFQAHNSFNNGKPLVDLLHTPGRTVAHTCALPRTTANQLVNIHALSRGDSALARAPRSWHSPKGPGEWFEAVKLGGEEAADTVVLVARAGVES